MSCWIRLAEVLDELFGWLYSLWYSNFKDLVIMIELKKCFIYNCYNLGCGYYICLSF